MDEGGTNWRGDVVALYNSNGTIAAKYEYDAYGKLLSVETASGIAITGETSVAIMNPLRYRGYVYDNETGLYYNSTRYYDPTICRFVNADTTDVLTATLSAHNDKNLFAYCDNNPVSRADYGGEFWNYVIGGVVGAVVGGVSAAISGGDWKAIALGAGVGAVGGLLAASGIPAGFQIAAGGLLSGANNLATQTLIEGKSLQEVDKLDVIIDTAIGAGTSALSYGLTYNTSKAAESTIKTGINKIISGKDTLSTTGRYGKGTIKKGLSYMREGIRNRNIARGTSSVIGSTSTGVLTSIKTWFKNLFR